MLLSTMLHSILCVHCRSSADAIPARVMAQICLGVVRGHSRWEGEGTRRCRHELDEASLKCEAVEGRVLQRKKVLERVILEDLRDHWFNTFPPTAREDTYPASV